jgi:hypothetical protein
VFYKIKLTGVKNTLLLSIISYPFIFSFFVFVLALGLKNQGKIGGKPTGV